MSRCARRRSPGGRRTTSGSPEASTELDRILESAHEAFISIDEAGAVVAWNSEAERVFGWPKAEALGQLLRDLIIPEEYRERHQEGLARFIATGEGPLLDTRIEITALHRSGREFPVELTISAVRAETWRFHAFIHDISDRRRADELRARLAAIVEHSADAIVTRDVEGRVTSWNPGAEQLFGWTAEEMLGETHDRLVPPEREGEAGRLLERVLAGEPIRGFETERVRKDGSLLDVSITISPIRDAEGRITEVSLVARDIGARKESERTLARTNEELAQANEAKTRFVAVASHELRTPLASIGGFAKTLLARWDDLDDEQKRTFLSLIDTQGERLTRIVDDLLTLSRIQAGKLRSEVTPVDLEQTVRRVLDELGLAEVTRVEANGRAPVAADPDHVHHVFLNYLANAKAYGAPPFSVTLEPARRSVVARVCDSGPGVPEEFVPYLFESFSQASPAAPGGHGSGLGLAIVRGLAEDAGGAAWYEPRDGGGACFCVSLPRL